MFLRADWDQLLLDARAGDLRALGRLVDVANDDLMAAAAGVLRRSMRARLPAEEVFSDAMLSVVCEIGSLRATNYIGFRYWFASIARNHVRRKLRDLCTRAGPPAEEETAPEEGDVQGLSEAGQGFLRCALLRLPRSQQVAFTLREGFTLTWRTIGFVLERREAPAARLIHYRAVSHVKDLAGARPDVRHYLASIPM